VLSMAIYYSLLVRNRKGGTLSGGCDDSFSGACSRDCSLDLFGGPSRASGIGIAVALGFSITVNFGSAPVVQGSLTCTLTVWPCYFLLLEGYGFCFLFAILISAKAQQFYISSLGQRHNSRVYFPTHFLAPRRRSASSRSR
jgi:hypothetical protein